MPGNYPEENIQHTEHGEILKSRILHLTGVRSCCLLLVSVGSEISGASVAAFVYTVESSYNDISLCDTLSIASDILWL
jgi:hypothetical protein